MARWTYWKCPECHGTGREIVVNSTTECMACAGTGNALVDGAAAAYRRRLREIEEREKSVRKGGADV